MPPEVRNVWENNLQMAKQFVVDILDEKIISLNFLFYGNKTKTFEPINETKNFEIFSK